MTAGALFACKKLRRLRLCLICSPLLCLAAGAGSVWDGAYTKGQSARGKGVYLEECAKCHGENPARGRPGQPGPGPGGPGHRFRQRPGSPHQPPGGQLPGGAGGEGAPPLVGKDFIKSWYGKSAGDLLDRIIKTMPTDDPGSLSHRQYADITAYILNQNEFPAGAKDLDSSPAASKDIRIEEKK